MIKTIIIIALFISVPVLSWYFVFEYPEDIIKNLGDKTGGSCVMSCVSESKKMLCMSSVISHGLQIFNNTVVNSSNCECLMFDCYKRI